MTFPDNCIVYALVAGHGGEQGSNIDYTGGLSKPTFTSGRKRW
jgi:hypothetical protein